MKQTIFVTGGTGYLGSEVIKGILKQTEHEIVCVDIRGPRPELELEHERLKIEICDIRDEKIKDLIHQYQVDTVIHLASVVTPGKDSSREFEYEVDVLGTKNLLSACIASKVKRLIVTSSGAAYGYHPDSPEWITEQTPLRGNYEFAYSHHKKLVENMLAECRETNPELIQVIFRPGTILGNHTENQITNLFKQPGILDLNNSDSRFVFIWDQDCVGSIVKALDREKHGIFNLAGDGTLNMKEIAKTLGKPFLSLPESLVSSGLGVGKKLKLTQYGPEQIGFLKYRPVLANKALKEDLGYTPRKTSEEAFRYYLRKQKVVFITGGTSGLGLEVVKHYHKRGHIVAASSIEPVEKVRNILPSGVTYYQSNVNDTQEMERVIEEFAEREGRLDLVVANAGISMHKSKVPNFDLGRRVIQTNVIGVMNTFEPAIKIMKKQKEGQIAALSSLAGVFGGIPGMAIYGASKSAVFTMCEALEIDLKKMGIHVTTLAPGFIKTPLTTDFNHSKPFELSQEEAGEIIFKSLEAKKNLYLFPMPMSFVAVILRRLPRSLYKKIMGADLLGTGKSD